MRSSFWLVNSLKLAAWLSAAILLLILFFLINESLPLIQRIGLMRFFTDESWHPLSNLYWLVPMLLASFYMAVGAVLLATPLGVVVAIFGHYYAPELLAKFYRGLLGLLSGIPSVVFGLWGMIVIVPFIVQWMPPGASLLAGIIVLTIMILPLVALTTDAALKRIPITYMRTAISMGLSRWGTIRRIFLPVAFPGILSGVVLQSGRALGETMAVLMVSGNVVQIPSSLFQPVRTLTANIALEMSYAMGEHRLALFCSGLLLLCLTIALVLLANYISRNHHA
tara:strand:- start:79637 stop:80479 length:843 start_codon:yes stop_codon:yes gene_type:complete